MTDLGTELANRAIKYGSELSAIATAGLIETLHPRAEKSTWEWLIEDKDAGYSAGLLAAICGSIALIFQLWWLAVPLIVLAFVLCWLFG